VITEAFHAMSIYDQRDRSAYGDCGSNPLYCTNPYILKWWTDAHDRLLSAQIEEKQWIWAWTITQRIVAISRQEDIDEWKEQDPNCSKYVWYNVLMNFARSRAEKLGLTNAIRKPEWKRCPLCGEAFVEDSLPVPLVERLGIDQLDFCAPCLSGTILQNTGNDAATKDQIRTYLQDLSDILKRIPPQDFGGGMYDLREMSTEERLEALLELKRKPTQRRVKELFGSWFKALIDAELLEDGARRTSLGTQCLAKDGHMSFSLGEKTIDDLLHALGILHEREPAYPEGNFRADFVVNGVFIEYFGLAGDAEYDAKSSKKKMLCQAHGIKLIAIFPKDLVSSRKLESMILTSLGLIGHRAIG
jgi:hypothetical protein